MPDPTLKIIITAQAEQATNALKAIAEQISDLAKATTTQVKMAMPKVLTSESKKSIQEDIKYINLAISAMIKYGADAESVYQAISKAGEISATDRLKHEMALMDREIRIENENAKKIRDLEEAKGAAMAKDLIAEQKLKEKQVYESIKSAKTIAQLETLKTDALKLQGEARLKATEEINRKIEHIETQSVGRRKAILDGIASVAVRAGTGVLSAFERYIPSGLSLTTRAFSDVLRSIPNLTKGTIGSYQAFFRAVGRVFEGGFRFITNIYLNIFDTLYNITTKILSKIFEIVKRTFQGIILAIGAFFVKAVYDLSQYSHSINSILTLIEDSTTDTFEKMFSGVLAIVREIPSEFGDVASSVKEIISTGFGEQSALLIAKEAAEGAVAGFTSVKTATQGLLTVMSTYNIEAIKATYVNDLLFKTIDISRASYEQLNQVLGNFIGIGKIANVTLEDTLATFSLISKIQRPELAGIATARVIESLVTPTREAEQIMRQTGFLPFIEDEFGNRIFKGMENIINELREKNFSTRMLNALFPEERAFRGIASLLALSLEDTTRTFTEFGDVSGTKAKAYQKAVNDMVNASKQLWSNVKLFGVNLLRPFVSIFETIIGKFRDFVKDLNVYIETIIQTGGFDRIKQKFEDIFGKFELKLDFETFNKMFSYVETSVMTALSIIEKLPSKIKELIDITYTSAQSYIPSIIGALEEGGKVAYGIGNLLWQGIKYSIPALKEMYNTITSIYNVAVLFRRVLAPPLGTGDFFKVTDYMKARSDFLKLKAMQEKESRVLNIEGRIKVTETPEFEETLKKAKDHVETLEQELGILSSLQAPTIANMEGFESAAIKAYGTAKDRLKIYMEEVEKLRKELFAGVGTLAPTWMERYFEGDYTKRFSDLTKQRKNKQLQEALAEEQERKAKYNEIVAGSEKKVNVTLQEKVEVINKLGLVGKEYNDIVRESIEAEVEAYKTRDVLTKETRKYLDELIEFETKQSGLQRLQRRVEISQSSVEAGKGLRELTESGKYSFEELQKSAFSLRRQLVDTFGAGSEQVRAFEQDIKNLNLISKDFRTTLRDVFSAEKFEEQINFFKNIAQSIVGAIHSITDEFANTLSNFFQTGKFGFRDFTQFIRKIWFDTIAQIIAQWIRMQIITGLANLGLTGLGSTSGSSGTSSTSGTGVLSPNYKPFQLGGTAGFGRHSGGMITENMPRFHSGGLGLFKQDERPAILQTGEGVLSRQGIKNLGMLNNGQSFENTNVPVVNINLSYNVDSLFPVVDSDADKKIDSILLSKSKIIAYAIKQQYLNQKR